MKPETKLAKYLFANKNYKDAKSIFLNEKLLYEAGLCALISGSKESARLIWNEAKDSDIAVEWGLIAIDLIEGVKNVKKPGYFQIRAFLEVYIGLLIEEGYLNWAENIISAYKFLLKSNAEAPKFIARVLFSYGYFNLVYEFSEIAKEVCYYDPEIHFIESQTYFFEKKYDESLVSINNALKVAPEYYPALKMKKIILNEISA